MLNQTLEAISQKVRGTVAVMVVGLDGFIIEQQAGPDIDLSLEAVAAEIATLLRQTQTTTTDMNVGGLEEMDLRTEQFYILVQKITNDYFLCLIQKLDGLFGRARFELRKAKSLLASEFVI
ncbi:MAG: roadblock/LC7 domain-containing protein [Acidobacteriia bacterium]|nr:roadblock/LC7 domain-containing protein [Terriglobia bacterium]